VGDSLFAKPRLDAVTLLAALAGRTKTLKLGPACLASFPLRNPLVFAYEWASLDCISEGRTALIVCAGGGSAGDWEAEARALKVPVRERQRRLNEHVAILRKLWSEERVTYEGRFYQLEDAFVEPKPVQKLPPIWVIGNPSLRAAPPHVIERNLRRVARLGDGWMTTAWPAAEFAELRRRICAYAKDYGRSFEELPCALYYNININDDREAAIQESQRFLEDYYTPIKFPRDRVEGWVACGAPKQCIQQLQTFIDAGATDILLRFPSWDQKTQFKRCVEEVLPHVT
jgi:alkanesulfonate monooxygenase SsuD/methylene tetrahydromethanopterin reductase-like flavin-dependent oxidoreductase (luciferase family)